ncbi:MAG TPA: hypothetical protein EYP59_13185 [Thiotrichaceae bacterium]|nr:hypothetical protein [Thiotrichaceae bacterium]
MKNKFWNTTITLLTLVWLGLSSLQPQAAEFSDVLCGHWFQDEVILLKNKGILASREKFEPSRKVSRAEFIKMLISTMATKYREEKKEGDKKKVADCSDEEPWYKCFIKEAYRIKNPNYEDEPIAFFLKEELNNKLGRTDWILEKILELPKEESDRKILHKILTDINASDGESYLVSRSDAAHMMMNASRLAPAPKEAEFFEEFRQVNPLEKDWIGACKKAGIFNGSQDSKTKKWHFNPRGELNRSEAAVILARAFFKSEITRLAQCNSVTVDMIAHQAGTMASPGAAVAESDEYYPEKLQVLANDDWDEGGKNRYRDHYRTGKWDPSDSDDKTIGSKDDDIVKLTLKPLKPLFGAGTMKLIVSEPAAVRIFKADGTVLSNYSVDLAKPEGDLAALASSPVDLYVETLKPSLDISIKLAFERVGGVSKASESDKVHMISTFESILRSNIVRAAYIQDNTYRLKFPSETYQPLAICVYDNPYWENKYLEAYLQQKSSPTKISSSDFDSLIQEIYKYKNADGVFAALKRMLSQKLTDNEIKIIRRELVSNSISLKSIGGTTEAAKAIADLIPFQSTEKQSSGKYMIECLGAMATVWYRGVLETFREADKTNGDSRFNTCFKDIQFGGSSKPIPAFDFIKNSGYYPGDWRYVDNPDYNTDADSSWVGENTIQLENDDSLTGMFYWHNGDYHKGVTTLADMRKELHKHRLPNDKTNASLPPREATLKTNIKRLNVLKLMKAALTGNCP